MENYITEYFLIGLSTFHNLFSTKRDKERLSDPNTTSYLYNFSRDLNASALEID